MKRFVWVVLALLAISSTSWGELVTSGSAGGVGMVDGQTIGRILVPGWSTESAGAHIGVQHSVMNAGGTSIYGTTNNMLCNVLYNLSWGGSTECGSANDQCGGNNDQCGGNNDQCGGNNDQQDPPCNPGCWPNWPSWYCPWGNVTTSSNSTASTVANGPDCSAVAETSGMSVGPGASSSSHSYAESVNP
jgi:hypothetical protein